MSHLKVKSWQLRNLIIHLRNYEESQRIEQNASDTMEC